MEELYFKVLAKCGHVRRNNFITKWFYVKANSRKEAANIVRYKPRVKHDHKDAIKEAVQIEYDEYIIGVKIMASDIYFKAHNIQEQRLYNCIKEDEIYPEEKTIKKNKDKNDKSKQKIMYELIEHETKKLMRGKSYDE